MRSQIAIHGVRGTNSIISRPKSHHAWASLIVDFSIFPAVWVLSAAWLNFSPIPSMESLVWGILAFVGSYASQLKLWGQTLGQRIWVLVSPDRRLVLPHHLIRTRHFDASRTSKAWALTAVALSAALGSTGGILYTHPLFQVGTRVALEPFIPENPHQWHTLSFYYVLGLFPKQFESRTILFSLPYAKGPPARFLEGVSVRMRIPDIRLTVEGPKTPQSIPHWTEIRRCIVNGTPLFCSSLREKLLWRHISEMETRLNPSHTKTEWFEVDHPKLPVEARPRGIRLVGWNSRRAEERYILINPLGNIQALILERPVTPSGEEASELIQKTLRSLRIEDSLDRGRSYINARLAEVTLSKIKTLKDPKAITESLGEIQSMLISKLSVEPKDLSAYYHLGGVALLLAKHAQTLRASGRTDLLDLDEWTTTAKVLARSAFQYAQDLEPAGAVTKQLQSIWLEAKGL